MEIEIDKISWEKKQNQQTPRLQSELKEAELNRQLIGLLESGVIRKSKAKYWSQVHLAPKPEEKWRFCIDYRRLNATTYPTEGHPLPRIDHMLQRLGRRKAKYFGVIDLTAGYHQMPLAPEAIPLTAFVCFAGLFEFLRVPFGLKNAGSYFQRFIATVVLAGLMYSIVENYIDDVILSGQTEDDFVANVKAVFERFDKHNIKVNPKKMKLGLARVECVGHIVDEHGLHFSRSKLDSVLNFHRPETAAQMKSFLGLANYFRDHVRGYSDLSRPLSDMVSMNPYQRRKKLIWTPETIAAFDALRLAIHECPKLFFLQLNGPIHLYTDASDFGIGAYLTQLIEGQEYPIAFISKTLNASQRRWSTPEKECYAIYYSLVKLEYLLLDREFVIHTDHKNLTFLEESANARVNRWKLALQEYSFTIEYIKGVDNLVADSFSRLCLLSEGLDLTEEDILSAFEESEIDDELLHNITTSRLTYPVEFADILGKVHNSEIGHHGVEKTMNLLLNKGHRWEYMRQHVKAFVKNCPCCQIMSQIKPAIHTLPFTTASYNPMESLNVDTIGPLPSDEDGFNYILVVIDRFSRWIELYPTKDPTAKSAAKSLLNHFGRYGAAYELRSDSGSQYVNEIIEQLLLLIGTQHDITLAYSKQENSIVERSNKEVLRHLRNIIFDKRVMANWSVYLPLVQRIINSAVHSSLGVSPAQILFANAIDLDRNIFPDAKEFSISYANLTLSQYAADLITAQDIIIKVAQDHQLAKDEKHLKMHEKYMEHEKFRKHHENSQPQPISRRKRKRMDKNNASDDTNPEPPTPTIFPVNSFVLVAYPENSFTKRARPPNKLMPEWKGPYQVISFIGANYTLLNLVTMKEESEVHVKRLKQFEYIEGTDPRDIANQATDAYYVEEIISHTGSIKARNDMTFLVKWLGYEEPTSEPYSNRSLFKTAAMHKYLRANKLIALIPAAYKN
jgi:cleavage and polyadenylation specificity factor subunit 1